MDAQNAVEPASTKPAASPQRPGSESDQAKSVVAAKLFSSAKPEAPSKDGRPSASASNANDEDSAVDGNSDAETIVLPGKDGHSPSKVRKIIKREDKSDAEDGPSVPRPRKHDPNGKHDGDGDKGDRAEKKDRSVSVADGSAGDRAGSLGAKKKKLAADKPPKAKDGSSGLSSAPSSPPWRRRRVSNAQSKSDSENAQAESPKASSKDKDRLKPSEKLVPHKRKAPRPDSDDEAENRKVRRQRTSGSGLDASRKAHPHPAPAAAKPAHNDAHPSTRTRSVSPQPRTHRRSISTSASTQLPGHSSNGLSHKKKRVPAPLQSTDYHSDESSASGSPHPRSSKLRSLTTPATAESTVSPAKMVPHKKHLDAHGQTFLARACAKGEFEAAKQRLQERPEDINVADYAGNTPLQIAALNGYDDIVKLLVDAGCNLDCVNNDKDTPLLDAVENGHLEVIKILLEAGVNPRKANAYGEEPIDRVNEDADHVDEIRRALREAKAKMGERRPTSEDHHLDHTDARSSRGPESPRRSPGPAGSIHAATGRRAGTVRSTKTSNHLLYMPMDDKTLRAAAARGDEETVTRILVVRDSFDDPESMVAAARGGHDMVMQLLLALGKANPDPMPNPNNEYSTPMLAAIGQENTEVIKLLLSQNFDPTRRINGETYYDIAKRRKGPKWIEEEELLKRAYDQYRKTHRGEAKTKSPNRREQDREARRGRIEAKDKEKEEPPRAHKRKASSPTRESKKTTAAKTASSPKEKRRSNSFSANPDEQSSPKRGPGRPKKDGIPTIAISDREASPAGRQPTAKAKRAESDLAAASSEGETVKPRRKLVSGRELKGERAQVHRRASMTSTTSSLKEPSSPREEPEKAQMTEKYHDRAKALKRDESRDRLSVSGESTGKRHRSSATPPHLPSTEKEPGDGSVKRRRLDVDPKEKRLKPSSTDDRRLKTPTPRDTNSAALGSDKIRSKSRDDENRKSTSKPRKGEIAVDQARRESSKTALSENSIHVRSEDLDVDMPDADSSTNDTSAPRAAVKREKEAEPKKKPSDAELQARESKRKEEKRRLKEEEEKKEKEREKVRLEEEAKRAEEAHRREEERKRKEDEERRQKEEKERKQREEERRRKEEEEEKERRRLEEAEKKRREEEEKERKRKEELEAERKREALELKRKKEEEERRRLEEAERKRQEEERLRKEQLEREAAEELRRKREEEERREQERKHQQEMERRRQAREAERAAREAARLEQERIRLAKLPPLLRWLDGCANPKLPEVAEKFRMLQGVRYDCIRPEKTGTAEGREQWLLNSQVALLLGEKDLRLSRYTAWNRIEASPVAKRIIWRLESDRYALTSPALYDLGRQLPEYYGEDPDRMSYRVTERLRSEAWPKFAQMELFFVKASDFMYIVPTVPHLRNIRLTMAYCEVPDSEADNRLVAPQKWRNDPDAHLNFGFAPGSKHYVNGELVAEDRPGHSPVSKTPFPEKRVPRRGLVAVSPDDPHYATLCKEQGLDHLVVRDRGSPPLVNGGLGSPTSLPPTATAHSSPTVDPRPLTNGNGVNRLVNGGQQ